MLIQCKLGYRKKEVRRKTREILERVILLRVSTARSQIWKEGIDAVTAAGILAFGRSHHDFLTVSFCAVRLPIWCSVDPQRFD